MIHVTLICLGRLKERYLAEACQEYAKRLTPFCKHNIIELNPEPLPANPSEAQIGAALAAEGGRILQEIPGGSRVYALCIEGTQRTSEAFSAELQELAVNSTSSVTFIIGSSYGLSDAVKQRADVKLSMSRMTFPHQLARVMLLEQLYRAFQISSGGKYHK